MPDQDMFPGGNTPRALSLEWIDDELFIYTRKVWEKHLGRSISDDEIIEMLLNVKRLAEVFHKANLEIQKNEATDQPES